MNVNANMFNTHDSKQSASMLFDTTKNYLRKILFFAKINNNKIIFLSPINKNTETVLYFSLVFHVGTVFVIWCPLFNASVRQLRTEFTGIGFTCP